VHIESPVAAFAEFAVADDVDAGFYLLANHLLDRRLETGFVTGLVVGLAGLDQLEELDELRRPHQAADVSGQDTVGHEMPLGFEGNFSNFSRPEA
jgi:hypothetical protein